MDKPEPRPRDQRRRDTEHRLTHDVDVWVASASSEGVPHLVPLSFLWDGRAVLVATPTDSPTGRNLAASGRARLGLGPTRDVTMIDGEVEAIALADLPSDQADRFAEVTGFDPRQQEETYGWFRIAPQRVRAWRESNELAERLLMRGGRWLA